MEGKEALFREKAKTYFVCFNDFCPRHRQCLRWEVGRYYDPEVHAVKCVSPLYSKATGGECPLFVDNTPRRMPVGMKQHFYYDMPGHIATSVKNSLIAASSRATYYKYHRGDRPITPFVQSQIESACRRFGWNGPFVYDSEIEDYVWD